MYGIYMLTEYQMKSILIDLNSLHSCIDGDYLPQDDEEIEKLNNFLKELKRIVRKL